jgi:hypothetical protein
VDAARLWWRQDSDAANSLQLQQQQQRAAATQCNAGQQHWQKVVVSRVWVRHHALRYVPGTSHALRVALQARLQVRLHLFIH